MRSIRNAILQHVKARKPAETLFNFNEGTMLKLLRNHMCSSTTTNIDDRTMDRVIDVVKKFDKVKASKVTEKANFQMDLSLDSLDRVELIMAFEQEFSIEIPDDKADKLTCCADVAKYIASETSNKT